MSWPRKDEQAERMNGRYSDGLSLAQVAAEFGVSRQSVWEMLTARGFKLRDRPAPLPAIHYGGRKYTMRNTGYYGATSGDRHLLHRRIWEDANGPIPDGYDIHHRDENKTNNSLENFECLPKAEHTRLYSPNCNQFSHKCGKADHDHTNR